MATALLASSPFVVVAQEFADVIQDDVSPQLWADFNPSWRRSPKFEVYSDIGVRKEIGSSTALWRFVVRPSVRYSPSRDVRISGGIGNFLTVNDVIANRYEFRPWQGVSLTWPRSPLVFEHFVRLEEIFDFNTRTWESLNSLRGRYRLRGSYDWAPGGPGRYWRIMGSIEGFLTLVGESGQSRELVRLTVGLERGHRDGRRTRLDATWQKEARMFGGGTVDDIFLRLRVFARLN